MEPPGTGSPSIDERQLGLSDGLRRAPSGRQAVTPGDSPRASTLPDAVAGFLARLRLRLRDRRFWAIQSMVLAVTAGHAIGEIVERVTGHQLGAIYFIPASLYFFPVIYASLNFGREGAIPTAVWAALLAIPNVVIWHHGLERIGEAFQMTVMILLATVIAGRVDKEIAARKEAEEEERARRLSQLKYHALFDGAAEPILVFDGDGIVQEANVAAAVLIGRTDTELIGRSLTQLFGSQGAELLLRAGSGSAVSTEELAITSRAGAKIWVEPLCTRLPSADGSTAVQAVLRDVTERRGFQSYAQEIVRAQEEERARIARELHDIGLQSVILLCRRLDTVEEAAGHELPESVGKALVEARRTAEDIADGLRRFSRDLRPVILEDLGLVPAVKRLVSETSDRSSVRGRLVVTGEPRRLSASAELSIFRIAQEALRNVERHAGASHVTVKLGYQAHAVRVTVTDDGKGFELPLYTTLASSGKLGLLGMRERARLAGGTCDMFARPGKGTRVEVSIPS